MFPGEIDLGPEDLDREGRPNDRAITRRGAEPSFFEFAEKAMSFPSQYRQTRNHWDWQWRPSRVSLEQEGDTGAATLTYLFEE